MRYLVIVVSVLVAALIFWSLTPRPSHLAAEVRNLESFERAIQRSDWGALYDHAPPSEFRERGVTRKQFIGFMKDVSSHLRPTDLGYLLVSPMGANPNGDKAHRVRFPRLTSKGLSIHEITENGIRYVSVSTLPLTLAFADQPREIGAATMARALRAAKMPSYRIHMTKISGSVDAFERVALRKVDMKKIWKRTP